MPMRKGRLPAGHDAKLFLLAEMNFDAILHDGYRKEQPLEPDLRAAYEIAGVMRPSWS